VIKTMLMTNVLCSTSMGLSPPRVCLTLLRKVEFLTSIILMYTILMKLIPLIFYNWLADSATTSHVCHRCEDFMSFHLLTATTVTGVGNLETKAEG
jgi:hypothetical protein